MCVVCCVVNLACCLGCDCVVLWGVTVLLNVWAVEALGVHRSPIDEARSFSRYEEQTKNMFSLAATG